VTYKGTIEGSPHAWELDSEHLFVTDRETRVCGNSADMISKTRYATHFSVTPRKQHTGLFDCSGSSCNDNQSSCCC
jgi:arsenite methyltransferase